MNQSLPKMTDFNIDEAVSILVGVKPQPKPKLEKQNSSKKSKKPN